MTKMTERNVLILATALGLVLGLAGCQSPTAVDRSSALPNPGEQPEGGADKLIDDAETVLRIADATKASGNVSAALPLYRRAVQLAPTSQKMRYALASVLSEQGAIAEAIEIWEGLIDTDPNALPPRLGFGAMLLGEGQAALARDQFIAAKDIVANDPMIEPDVRIYNGLGVSEDLLGNGRMAQSAYRTGLEIWPDNDLLMNNLALSLAISGDPAAVEISEKLANRPGAETRYRLNLALIHGLLGRMQMATDLLRQEFDETAVQQNIVVYQRIRALDTHAKRAAAIGAYISQLSMSRGG